MTTYRTWVMGLVIGLSLLPGWGFARSMLTFIKPTDLPDLGLRLKLMPESREIPSTSPQVLLMQFTKGTETWKEERFLPVDLWKREQFAGQWVGRDGNKLLLAIMSCLPPDEQSSQPVTRATYEQQRALATNNATFTSEADLVRWISVFTDFPHPVGKRLDKQPARISPVWIFRLDSISPNRVAYVFRLTSGAGKNASTRWVCAQFDLNTDLLMEPACEIIEKEFLSSISALTLARTVAPNRETLTRTSESVPDSEVAKAAQQQVIDSIRNLKGWWYDVTPDFIILSNLKGSAGSLVDQFKTSMKVMRVAYRQSIPEPAKPFVGVVRIPATLEEYREYVGEDNGWSRGLWMPGRKELVICPAGDQGARGNRQTILRIAYHEGFHQYAYYAFGQANASLWFNEGYAQFFENVSFSNGRLIFEESPQALRVFNTLRPGTEMDLNRLINLGWKDFYDRDEKTRAANYALSWALVYYLKKDPACPFAGLLDKYVEAMQSNGGNAEKANESMLANIDVKRLQTDFERFWQSAARQSAARRYNPLDLHK